MPRVVSSRGVQFSVGGLHVLLPRGVRRRGTSLVVQFTRDGHKEARSLGRVTVKFAQQQREIFLREIAEGRYVKPVKAEPAVKVEPIAFAEICDRAVTYYKNYTRCWDAVEGRVSRLKEWWKDRTAESITTAEINEHLLANLAPHGLKWSKTTANEYRVTLLRIFALAVERSELTVNSAAKAKRHKLENARVRELSFAEEDVLREVIRKKYPAKEVEFDLALHTGCRRSNLYGQHNAKRAPMPPLDGKDVNLDWKVITFSRSKAGAGYQVPLNETAIAALKILRERGDGTGPVIRKPRPIKTHADGRELHSSRRWFENCLAEARIENFRWHDLRNTFATRLRRNKVALEDIRILLGHNIKSITERYAHADMDSLHEAVATLVERRTERRTSPVWEFSSREAV
jgi:integrase